MDHGYPQTTETKILKEFIKTESYKMNVTPTNNNISNYLTSAVTWRKEGIKYKVNQAFLDVVEKVNSLV
jgi:AP-1 complex subunit mu